MSKSISSIVSYIQELKRDCKGGEGIPDIISEVPNIFITLQRLVKDKDLDNNNRLMVFAAIGYFFIPDDLFPEEELGQIGYVDDVILCLTIFREISLTPLGQTALIRNWVVQKDINEVIGEILTNLTEDYPEQYLKVLDHVGLLPDEVDLDIN